MRKERLRTPNEDDFCSCGGIFSLKRKECTVCGKAKTKENRWVVTHYFVPDRGMVPYPTKGEEEE